MLVFLVTVLMFFSGDTSGSDNSGNTLSIAVFEDHERYVEASSSYGLSWQLFSYAAEKAGFSLELYPSSWRASMSLLQNEKVDLVFGALRTKDREQWAIFSVPLITEGSALFVESSSSIKQFSDIDTKTMMVGVSANSVQADLARSLGFENIYETIDRPQLYDMLAAKRLDLLFFGTSIIDYYCTHFNDSQSSQCMRQVSPLYATDSVHVIALSTNSQSVEKLALINQTIVANQHSKVVYGLFEQYPNANDSHSDWVAKLAN
ncbi:substrate-binding periplasmic protein [Alteromonas flava]|uniref:substrate-binding periplasmic protein n=1 Tax=Alteromonas flava TaxID=2048003 RepID=UPI0013DB1825|nr:transporter substrate-binding domain-containing protein [Alteromonas flava]